MNLKSTIEHLHKNKTPISKKKDYSDLPGVYALFFMGKRFLIEDYQLPEDGIIYIGKTLNSQKSRNANTHFKTGKTGSSTVRKSIGALLSQYEEMIPEIRSQSDVEKNRKSHFKFDLASEEKITKWMKENLAVSFFEYPKSRDKIEQLERLLIETLQPVLNLTGEFQNLNKPLIQRLRKQMGMKVSESVHSTIKVKNEVKEIKEALIVKDKLTVDSTLTKNKYIQIWKYYLPFILKELDGESVIMKLEEDYFIQAGNRKNFSFRIEFINNKVNNNIDGSAVARDLVRVLQDNDVNMENKVIRLSKDFILEMS